MYNLDVFTTDKNTDGLHDPEDEGPTFLQNFNIFQLRHLKINKHQVSGNTV